VAERFARTWERGWAAHDVDLIGALYADGCTHRSMPFRPVHRGRLEILDYIRWSFDSERATDGLESPVRGDARVGAWTAERSTRSVTWPGGPG
jgi:hypothetical protein